MDALGGGGGGVAAATAARGVGDGPCLGVFFRGGQGLKHDLQGLRGGKTDPGKRTRASSPYLYLPFTQT